MKILTTLMLLCAALLSYTSCRPVGGQKQPQIAKPVYVNDIPCEIASTDTNGLGKDNVADSAANSYNAD